MKIRLPLQKCPFCECLEDFYPKSIVFGCPPFLLGIKECPVCNRVCKNWGIWKDGDTGDSPEFEIDNFRFKAIKAILENRRKAKFWRNTCEFYAGNHQGSKNKT